MNTPLPVKTRIYGCTITSTHNAPPATGQAVSQDTDGFSSVVTFGDGTVSQPFAYLGLAVVAARDWQKTQTPEAKAAAKAAADLAAAQAEMAAVTKPA